MTVIDVGGSRLHACVVGSGPTVVVLYGGPDFDHEYLGDGLDLLAEEHRLVAYAQRGRGRSFRAGEPTPVVTMDTEVADLDRVCAWAGEDRVARIGHSWGCLLAFEYALRHPERVSHLVLLHPVPSRMPRPPSSGASWVPADARGAGPSWHGSRRIRRTWRGTWRRTRPSTASTRPDAARSGASGRARPPPAGGLHHGGVLAARAVEHGLYDDTWRRPDYDLVPRLRELRIPTLLLHGRHDIIAVETIGPIAAAITGARLEVLPGLGRFAFLESPETVLPRIAAFLAGDAGR